MSDTARDFLTIYFIRVTISSSKLILEGSWIRARTGKHACSNWLTHLERKPFYWAMLLRIFMHLAWIIESVDAALYSVVIR